MSDYDLRDSLGAFKGATKDHETWPAVIAFEIDDIDVQDTEPDVGIFNAYVEGFSFSGWIDAELFSDSDKFAAAIAAAIGAEDVAEVAKFVEKQLHAAAVAQFENTEPDFDDHDPRDELDN